jgi:endonuclease G
VDFDTRAKVPIWASYTLTPEHAIGCIERSNAFASDQSLPADKRSTPDDYNHSGYDQGHQVPDGDQSWDPVVEHESFIMTNMAPQLPGLNRGIWKALETYVRIWAWQQHQPLTIYVGPIYSDKSPVIGADHVVVPDAFYKVVINDVTHEAMAWILPQQANLKLDLTPFRIGIHDLEQITQIGFPVPADIKELPFKQMWPANSTQFLHDKQQACKR